MGIRIDGKERAREIREGLKLETDEFKAKTGITPKLTVVLVGEDPASQVYVRNKEKACAEIGFEGETLRLPASIGQDKLISEVRKLNSDESVHGILVQLPLPQGYDPIVVLNELSAEKDVDGLHPLNMGKLLRGEDPLFLPCTPAGIMDLILSTGIELKGKDAVVVGRSNIVGKPMALLLLQRHATVTICHSRTKDLGGVCKRADVLVAAVGRAKMINKDMVKNQAVVIDVGMNRDDEGKLCGDVDYAEVEPVTSYITPVPKGVGPMTIAMLMKNTLLAAKRVSG